MKRLFIFLVLCGLGVGGMGFYRGWWTVQSGGEGGKTGVSLTVDKQKIAADKEKAVDTAHTVGHTVEAKVSR